MLIQIKLMKGVLFCVFVGCILCKDACLYNLTMNDYESFLSNGNYLFKHRGSMGDTVV